MKKLVIVAAIALAAIVSEAGTAKWKWSAANVYNGAGESATTYSGMAYMIDVATYTQSALYDAVIADSSFDVSKVSVASRAVSNGAIAANGSDFEYGQAGSLYSFYFVIVDTDKLYFSTLKENQAGNDQSARSLGFGNQAPISGNTSKTLPTDTYEGAGQWAAVPEPTSGLLMLIGMAGLALRRRRA